MAAATFAAIGFTLLVAHTIGDQWLQTGYQAVTKGRRDRTGALACLRHVATYTAMTAGFGGLVWALFGLPITFVGFAAGQAVSAVTHYWADRRWTLCWLVRVVGKVVNGKADYYDNGGAYPLDQAWHWLWLFAAALITALA